MENTTNPLLDSLNEVFKYHVGLLIEERLKGINEAAITDYVQKAINAAHPVLTNEQLDRRIEAMIDARMGAAAVNTQILRTLDKAFEEIIDKKIAMAISDHVDEYTHHDRADIEGIVNDMNLTPDIEDKISTYLDDNDYENKHDTASTVRSMLEEVTISLTVN